jgi:hypothetical protein
MVFLTIKAASPELPVRGGLRIPEVELMKISEAVIMVLTLLVWVVPVAFGIIVLILLTRIARAQEAARDKLAALEQLIRTKPWPER